MAKNFTVQNQTNPLIIEATGYAPYIKKRILGGAGRIISIATATKVQLATMDEEHADVSGPRALKENRRAQAIRDYWNRKKSIDELADYARDHEVNLFRNQWECEADRKALYSRVRWEMDKITSEMDKELEVRRARLSNLLKSEESQYLDEISVVQEDPEAKKERMMQRYSELKAQEEMERQQIAKEKKEQHFKQNCEEFRTLARQKIQKMTAEEGRKIISEKDKEQLEKNLEDKMYAELWAMDKEAKDLRDAREEEEKRKKNMKNVKFVQDQILKNRLEKQKKLREKEHDLLIMEERARLAALEEQCEKELKKKKQVELKRGLDECTREKLKRRAKEVQDDLMLDLFFMNQIAESEEEAAKSEKKRALMHEQQQYLKYLKDQIKAAADFEKQVDRMYQEELENIWKKREQEWQREKKKRRELEENVIREVQEQIRSNLEKARKVQEINRLYSQKILDEDAEDRKKAEEKLKLIRARNEANQREILGQIKMKEEELEEQKKKRDFELELLRREREEQERKIQQLLADMQIDKEHPFRTRAKEIC